MPRRAKYRKLPSLLADEEKQADASYYSEANRRAIVRRLPPELDSDAEKLFRTIEARAAFYVSWASEEPCHLTKFSDAKRRFEALWAALGKLIEDQGAGEAHPTERNHSRRLKRRQAKLAKTMAEIMASPDLREYCRIAAENVADRERRLPDFPAALVPIEGDAPHIAASRRAHDDQRRADAGIRGEPIVSDDLLKCSVCGLADQTMILPPPTYSGRGQFFHTCPRCSATFSLQSKRLASECQAFRKMVDNASANWIEGSDPAVITVWPVERQMAKAPETIEDLAWLRRVAAEAASLAQLEIELAADRAAPAMKMKFRVRVTREGKEIDQLKVEPAGQRDPTRLAGNRADEPLHWLIRVLVEIYCAKGAQPQPLRPRIQDNLTELSNSRQEHEREAARLRAEAATTAPAKALLVKRAQAEDQVARDLADQSAEI